mgnify:CR=1 FL=1
MSKYSFRAPRPASLRVWHWLNALVITLLLSTVLLRKTFLSWRTNSALLEERLRETGVTITPELAKELAVAIRNPLWDWHIRLGFMLGALLLGRIAIAFFVDKRPPVARAMESLSRAKAAPPHERRAAFHHALVMIGYATFYLVTLLMVATGVVLVFRRDLGLDKSLVTQIKEAHELMNWFFLAFVGAHLLGVVIAENGDDPGLISDMVNGGDASTKAQGPDA